MTIEKGLNIQEWLTPFERRIFASLQYVREKLKLGRLAAGEGKADADKVLKAQRIYVIARNHDWFIAFVRGRGLKLKDCIYIRDEEDVKGINFSSPLTELVLVDNWSQGAAGRENWVEACYYAIAMYKLHKRAYSVPEFIL